MATKRPARNKAAAAERSRPVRLSETIKQAVTIQRPVDEVFSYWKNLKNLPQFMPYLKLVEDLGGGRSRWCTEGPAGDVHWEAEITSQRENEIISWRSVGHPDVEHAGSVQFSPAPGDRGTELAVTLAYNPPAGKAGKLVAKVLRKDPELEIDQALRRFKQLLEAGEIATSRPFEERAA